MDGLVAAPVSAANSVAAVGVVAAVAEFAAGASVPFPAFLPRLRSLVPVADVPAPAFAGASAVPGPASAGAFPVVAGISYRFSRFQCWLEPGAPWEEGRLDELGSTLGCRSRRAAERLLDEQAGYTPHQPLEPV